MTTTAWLALMSAAVILGFLVGWLGATVRAVLRGRAVHADLAEARTQLAALKAGEAGERERFEAIAGAALSRREDAIKALVEPLTQSLEQARIEASRAERARLTDQATLTEQLRHLNAANHELARGTGELITALRSSQMRGVWGEMQLRRVVEAAGMLRRVDFDEQITGSHGGLRPDMVVHLAGGKRVVVDAKVALLGYLEAQQASDAAQREARLDAHVRHLRSHIDSLAAKSYWEQFTPTPEFVVMFVPAEAILSAAVERDAALLEYAAQRNVIPATPMTLLAMLKTVAYAWRQDALAANAQRMLDVGKELYGRVVSLAGHVTKTGNALKSATEHYNRMVGSLESQLLVSARRMVALDVVDETAQIDELAGIEVTPRPLTKPEFLAAGEQQVIAFDATG